MYQNLPTSINANGTSFPDSPYQTTIHIGARKGHIFFTQQCEQNRYQHHLTFSCFIIMDILYSSFAPTMMHAHLSSYKYACIQLETNKAKTPWPKVAFSFSFSHGSRHQKKTCTFPTPSFSKPVPGVESSNRTLGSFGRRSVRGAVNGSRPFSTLALLCSSSGRWGAWKREAG